MDITLIGTLIASVAVLAVLVYLMCRDAMKESWLEYSTQSRQQMRQEEKGKRGVKEELLAFANVLFSPPQKKKVQEEKKEKGGLLGNVYVRIFLFSLGIYLLFFAYFFITAKPPSFETVLYEAPLQKISQLSLESGAYAYALKTNGSEESITYAISAVPSCVGWLVTGADKSTLCIGKDGKVAGEKQQSNLSATKEGTLYLFSPWMLAVKEGWHWQVKATVIEKNSGANYSALMEYSCAGKETYKGKDAYKVRLFAAGQPSGFMLIDSQRRILLLQNSTLGEISLSSAPFLK